MSANNEIVFVEHEFSPESVVEYTRLRGTYKCGRFKRRDGRDLVSMAKRHLSAVGWTFYNQKIKKNRNGLRYESPNKRKFYSLLTACEWYVANETGKPLPTYQKKKPWRPKKVPAHHPKKKEKVGAIMELKEEAAIELSDAEKKKKKKKEELVSKPKRGPGRPRLNPENPNKKRKHGAMVTSVETKPTIMSKLIDADVVETGAKVYYGNKSGGSMKDGTVSRAGVVCSCCDKVFTLSNFEAHAGSTNHRPSANIFLEDGRSLQKCLEESKKIHVSKPKGKKKSAAQEKIKSISDSTCSACQLGGELILCDHCPSAYHPQCVGLEEKDVPEGPWFCFNCCCRICNLVSKENSYLQCAQCHHRYHDECLVGKGVIQPEYKPDENWCCGSACERVHSGLTNLLGKPNVVRGDNLAWTLLKFVPDNLMNNRKLNAALSVIKECFGPVIEPRTNKDIVKDIIYNKWSDLPRLNFQGFYTLVLGKNSTFYTTVLVRIHGNKVAEVPFVATRFMYRNKGMCRTLMNELEKKLAEFGVEKAMLPATDKMLDTWRNKFGYLEMNEADKLDFVGNTLLGFHDCIMCQKMLKKKEEFRGEEHVYDHFDRNTISEVFQEKGSDDVSQSFDQEMVDVSSCCEVDKNTKSSDDAISRSFEQDSCSEVDKKTISEVLPENVDVLRWPEPARCYKRRKYT